MALTTLQKLNIGKLSEAYSSVDIIKSGLFGGGMDLQLPRKIYCVRKSISWLYALDTTDDSLVATSNYLIALCGKYYLQAQAAIAAAGGNTGTVVTPTTPSSSFPYVFEVNSADFANATDYENTDIEVLALAFNDANVFLDEGTQWEKLSGGGFRVLLPGFDSGANNYTFYVFTTANSGTVPNVNPGTVVQVHTSGTTVTVANPTTWLIVNPASLLATLTVTLQAAPYDGQIIKISFGGTISGGSTVVTAITINANTGYTLLQDTTPSLIRSGDEISYKLYGTTWYRIN